MQSPTGFDFPGPTTYETRTKPPAQDGKPAQYCAGRHRLPRREHRLPVLRRRLRLRGACLETGYGHSRAATVGAGALGFTGDDGEGLPRWRGAHRRRAAGPEVSAQSRQPLVARGTQGRDLVGPTEKPDGTTPRQRDSVRERIKSAYVRTANGYEPVETEDAIKMVARLVMHATDAHYEKGSKLRRFRQPQGLGVKLFEYQISRTPTSRQAVLPPHRHAERRLSRPAQRGEQHRGLQRQRHRPARLRLRGRVGQRRDLPHRHQPV